MRLSPAIIAAIMQLQYLAPELILRHIAGSESIGHATPRPLKQLIQANSTAWPGG